jgi:hypothetical protein
MESALRGAGGRRRKAVLNDEDKTYVRNLACQKPSELGYAQELWTVRSLQDHIRRTCIGAGYPNLATIVPSTFNTILNDAAIKPHKIRYYLEKRDADFDKKPYVTKADGRVGIYVSPIHYKALHITRISL